MTTQTRGAVAFEQVRKDFGAFTAIAGGDVLDAGTLLMPVCFSVSAVPVKVPKNAG